MARCSSSLTMKSGSLSMSNGLNTKKKRDMTVFKAVEDQGSGEEAGGCSSIAMIADTGERVVPALPMPAATPTATNVNSSISNFPKT